MGYREYRRAGKTTRLPRMWGFEAEGAAAIVENRPIENPDTVASALRIGNPANWQRAVRARDDSGGLIATVSDPQIFGGLPTPGGARRCLCRTRVSSLRGRRPQDGRCR